MDDRASLLGQLTRVAATTATGAPLTLRLCLALDEILGMDGSSLSVGYGASSRVILCSTDARAKRIEDLQDVLREGPGLDAHRQGRVISTESTEVAKRWPMLGQALAEAESPISILAVPMRPDQEVLGVITLYRNGSLPREVDPEEAQFLTDAIGVAVLGAFERAEPAETMWSARDKVDQAVGMVVAQLRLPPADAIAVLRAHAFARDMPLQTIAASVLTGDLVFHSPDDPEGTTTHDDYN